MATQKYCRSIDPRIRLPPMLHDRTEDLWKTYDMGSEQQVHALRGVNSAHPAQRVRRHHGTVGLGQIDADEPDRLPGLLPAKASTG